MPMVAVKMLRLTATASCPSLKVYWLQPDTVAIPMWPHRTLAEPTLAALAMAIVVVAPVTLAFYNILVTAPSAYMGHSSQCWPCCCRQTHSTWSSC